MDSSNHYAQALIGGRTTGANQGAVTARQASSTWTYYSANFVESSYEYWLRKAVAGAETTLGTYAAGTGAHTLRVTANGSTISMDVDGTERVSVTDSAITTGTYVGIECYNSANARWDDFVGADLASGVIVGAIPIVLTVTGVLVGAGALIGVVTTTLSVTGNISGSGALVGVITTLLTVTGVSTGIGSLLGVVSSQFSITSTLSSAASGAIIGTITTLLEVTGNLTGIGNLLGSSACNFNLAGLASGVGSLSSSILASLISTGVLVGAGYLVGGVTLLFGVTGAFYSPGSGDMQGYIKFRDGFISGRVHFWAAPRSAGALLIMINE
jgi:hypothetical protein